MNSLIHTLWLISIAGQAAVAVRLAISGLASRYRWLFVYCAFGAVSSLALSFIHQRSAYRIAWTAVEPVLWILQCGMVLEILGRIKARYQGVGAWTRAALWVILGLCLAASAAFTVVESPRLGWTAGLRFIHISTRYVAMVLALSLAAVIAFFSRFPVRWPRNFVNHERIAFAYFATYAILQSAFNVFGRAWIGPFNIAFVVAPLCCNVAWVFLLKRSGEVVAPRPVSAADLVELERLENLNAAALRFVGSFRATSRGLELREPG